jgi:hypothetical protein
MKVKVGKRDQKRIDKELEAFFALLTLSKKGDMLYDVFKRYLNERNMQVVISHD